MPAEFAGGADDAVLLTFEDAGENQGGAGPAMGFQPRQQVEKKMIVEIGDDEIGGRDGVTQDIPDTKTDACVESVQLQVPVRLLHGHGVVIPSLDLCPHPGGGKSENTGATAKVEHPAGLQAGAVLPHELNDVTETEAGGGVFARAKSGAGPDLKARDALEVLGKKAGVAGDDKVVADAEMEGGRFALMELADATLETGLELAKGENLGGVDLENGRLAGAFELGGG
jgi:hypothetical protein